MLFDILSCKSMWLVKPTTTQLLQHLGMKRGRIRRDIDPQRYKLVILDVTAESLCRPIQD